eukprot:TRINITY_DN12729_c0_g1_i1.p1 TRINITY_DN12729_c0_g1~~TRINITY_DN12729_c0_g1_i1.p1  ORF type:complete len:967 (+),score=184.93 TRINITY_DN12729_c0_g1_i1:86-2902(+)
MGGVFFLPPDDAGAAAFAALDAVLSEMPLVTRPVSPTPDPEPAEPGRVRVCEFPSDNATDIGAVILTWPHPLPAAAVATEAGWELFTLLHRFVDAFGAGSTSHLHKVMIAADTRRFESHASSVSLHVSDDPGHSVHFSLGGVRSSAITEDYLRSVTQFVTQELSGVSEWAEADLADFNAKVRSSVRSCSRRCAKFLQTPPRFGERGVYDGWLSYLDGAIELTPTEQEIDLSYSREAALIGSRLEGPSSNPWAQMLRELRLAETKPITVAAVASAAAKLQIAEEAAQRAKVFVDGLPERMGVADRGDALTKYREEFLKRSEALQRLTMSDELPPFTDDPPMSQDPSLRFEEREVRVHGKNVVVHQFPGMGKGVHFGIAMSLEGIPDRLLMHLAFFESTLSRVGVTLDGARVPHKEFCRRVEDETLYVRAYLVSNARTGRLEVAVRGAGLEESEWKSAMRWAAACSTSPDWSADNLPRIRDAVDSSLTSARKALDCRAEFWAMGLAESVRRQCNIEHLAARCSLTREHSLHRLKWRLREPDADAARFVAALSGTKLGRDALLEELTKYSAGEDLQEVPAPAKSVVSAAASDLQHLLSLMPKREGGLPEEWAEEVRLLVADLSSSPRQVLDEWTELLALVRQGMAGERSGLRCWVSGADAEERLHELLEDVILPAPSARSPRSHGVAAVAARWRRRVGESAPRPAAWCVQRDASAQGVVYHSAPCAADPRGPRTAAELRSTMAAKALSGGGAHTPFVKTWGAGLAYSSGVSCSLVDGRFGYYADTCPDVSKTLEFAREYTQAFAGSGSERGLADYALCQSFSSRAGKEYESRCESMADDLTDGRTPEHTSQLLTSVLEYRRSLKKADEDVSESVADELSVLFPQSGTAPPEASVAADGDAPADTQYWICAPAEQIDKYERLTGLPAARLHASDFWVVRAAA